METLKQTIPIKGKNIAVTSYVSFYEERDKGAFHNEEQQVLFLLGKSKPMTSRQIATVMEKDRGNITRTLFNLVYLKGKVKKAFVQPCPITKKKVTWYSLRDENDNNDE